MFHTIWPEGLPHQAFYTDRGLSAFYYVLKERLKQPFRFSRARRIWHATSDVGFPHPHIVEQRLRSIGAIAPPNGWPVMAADPIEHDMTTGSVRIVTHSVL